MKKQQFQDNVSSTTLINFFETPKDRAKREANYHAYILANDTPFIIPATLNTPGEQFGNFLHKCMPKLF